MKNMNINTEDISQEVERVDRLVLKLYYCKVEMDINFYA